MKSIVFGSLFLLSFSAMAQDATTPLFFANVVRCEKVDAEGNSTSHYLIGGHKSETNENGQLQVTAKTITVNGQSYDLVVVRFTSVKGEVYESRLSTTSGSRAVMDQSNCILPSDAGKIGFLISIGK